MAPNTALFLAEAASAPQNIHSNSEKSQTISRTQHSPNEKSEYEWVIQWRNVFGFIYLHSATLYGIYLMFFRAQAATNLWTVFVAVLGGMGITAGAHRLWAHRSYKAKWPLRLILAIFQTLAFQNHIYEWVRDHRVHHKFTDTDADPHNSRRGFFFSHMGWLMIKKHPDVKTKGKTVDMSDLEQDPIVRWQRRTYLAIMPLLCFAFPTWVPWYYWNENIWISWYVAAITRYTLSLNGTWLVNSAAHIWGTKPYDKSISPTNNLKVALVVFGEGWHNYHHVFPWDYKAAELGNYRANITTGFIDLFAKIGWAYDLKTVPVEMVMKRLARTGDGSHISITDHKNPYIDEENNDEKAVEDNDKVTIKELDHTQNINDHFFQKNYHSHHDLLNENHIWGWGDKDMRDDDIKDAFISYRAKER